MIEFVFVVVILLILLLMFAYMMQSESILIVEKERAIRRIEKMLKIAEKKFMKGKMKKEVFEELRDDLHTEQLNLEFELQSIRRVEDTAIAIKTDQLMQRTASPSRHKKLELKNLLGETEVIRGEMELIERKFLKHDIKESVFRKMMKEKETQLLRKESEIIEIVNGE